MIEPLQPWPEPPPGPRRCYVAGPMSGVDLHNFPAFFAAHGRLERAGWVVFNPAQMSADLWKRGGGLDVAGTPARRAYARQDLLVIIDELKAENGDAVVVLPGWENSKGARTEVDLAAWVHLQVLTVDDAVKMGGTR